MAVSLVMKLGWHIQYRRGVIQNKAGVLSMYKLVARIGSIPNFYLRRRG